MPIFPVFTVSYKVFMYLKIFFNNLLSGIKSLHRPKKHTFENLSRLEKQKPEITEPTFYRLFYRLYMASPICVNHGSASRFADSAQFLCKILTLSKNYKRYFVGLKVKNYLRSLQVYWFLTFELKI